MESSVFGNDILILLAISVSVVVIFSKLNLSPVLGYLIAGAVIGGHGYNIVDTKSYAEDIAEAGVVFLLFVIGLELSFERLIKMRFHVFGLGGLQLIVSSILIIYALHIELQIEKTSTMILIGIALSLSSTAIVLQTLEDNNKQSTQTGRIALSVLLMQDLAVIPLLAAHSVLSGNEKDILSAIGMAFFKATVVILVISICGRLLLSPFLSVVHSTRGSTIYVPTTLLIVFSASFLTGKFGMSSAMGAFLSGLFIAETKYRNPVEESIMPFKNLLLGLFFMTIGMSIDLGYVADNLNKILQFSFSLLAIKGIVIFVLTKCFKFPLGTIIHSSLLLSQGGEFAFILLSLLNSEKMIPGETAQILFIVVALTMAITPLLSLLGIFIEDTIGEKEAMAQNNKEFKGVKDLRDHVVISGFGRIGRVVAYILTECDIPYVAVDMSSSLVNKASKQGFPVYPGDSGKLDTLRALGIERASAIIITLHDKKAIRRTVTRTAKYFKSVKIITKVEDFRHGKALFKIGADDIVPDTIESGIRLGTTLLAQLKINPTQIEDLKRRIRENNYFLTEAIELFKGIVQAKHQEQKLLEAKEEQLLKEISVPIDEIVVKKERKREKN